jgi:peptidoglycan hydrolase-like protein with peptidoglycan-binding domain
MGALMHGNRLARLGGAALTVAAIAVAGSTAAGTASAAPVAAAGHAAVAAPAVHIAAVRAAAPASYTPPKRNLSLGMRGADVKALQQRLDALKYYAGTPDSEFGDNTLEAVWAFQEVNKIKATGVIDAATKKALVRPRAYTAKYPKAAGTRVEVNLGMGVLVFYKNHRIMLISHVSSGGHYYYPCGGGGGTCYAQTPTGEFHALYFVPGWDQGPLGAMYNPTFFNDDGDAIHGDTLVPVNPVSHGCVRIPMFIASWFYKNLHITEAPGKGTEIWVYNQW